MSFQNPPLYVEGGHHSGVELRGMLQDAARSNQGVGHSGDLKVLAMAAPAGHVRIEAGTCFITGVADPLQGSYWAKAPDETVIDITPTGGVGRSDLIVARVEDPTYEGGRTPDVDVFYPYVIEGVAAGTTQMPAGITGIVLARIDIPAMTAAITNAMIHDLRSIANPRRDRTTIAVFPGAAYAIPAADAKWLTLVGGLAIPSWASAATMLVHVSGYALMVGPSAGWVHAKIGAFDTQQTKYDENWTGSYSRGGLVVASANKQAVPVGIRGTTQEVDLWGYHDAQAGHLQLDQGSVIVVDVEFFEVPE